MFTGIIETTGLIKDIIREETNLNFVIESSISNELKIDQSVAHNGVCLTVVELGDGWHRVTAIDETLQKTNLGRLLKGNTVNLERCMLANSRYDGHMVYGHVDQVGTCALIEDAEGSKLITIEFEPSKTNLIVEKGSICLNGISLTIFNTLENSFQVAIIPYTWENTNLKELSAGQNVNLEFDIVGKYIAKLTQNYS